MKRYITSLLIMSLMVLILLPLGASANQSDVLQHNVNKMLYELGYTKNDLTRMIENGQESSDLKFKNAEMDKLKLKKKDILKLANLGFTKEQIQNFTLTEYNHFKDYNNQLLDVNTSYIELKKGEKTFSTTSESEYLERKQLDDSSNTMSAMLCDPYYGCSNSIPYSWIKVTEAVSKATSSSTRYGVTTSFKWLTKPNYRYTDLFGTQVKDNLTIDYNSIFGSYEADLYNDNTNTFVTSKTQYLGEPGIEKTNWYAHRINLYDAFYQVNGQWLATRNDNGYTYADCYLNNTSATSSTTAGSYTHIYTEYNYSWSIGYPWSGSITVDGTSSKSYGPSVAISFTK
jgi:hypothetical protein